jgi:beta-lactamase class D
MTLPFLLISLLILRIAGAGERYEERADFGKFYEDHKIAGAFLLYDLKADRYLVYNRDRAEQAFVPASTFKIFSSLVALETAVIADENEIFKWDGVDRGIENWNRDHNLRSAFKFSAVWFYQELARRIGPERMQSYIDKVGYGNRNINGGIDRFWLDGELRISLEQQIAFLLRLYQNQLPFSKRSLELVKEIMLIEETSEYRLRGKTGWSNKVGWFVGYLEQNGSVYFFANNVEMKQAEDAPARIEITKEILRKLNLL